MSVSEPGKIITPWAESGLKNTIPPAANPATGRAGFDQGFSAINMTAKEAGGIPPFGQDFNGIFHEITNILRYMQAGGKPTFSSALAAAIGGYPKGAMVLGDDKVTIYRNTVASNSANPNTGGDGWARPDLQMMELYRRSYAEAGYNVVGTFQAGFTIASASDVGIDLDTGKGYTGPAGVVDAGTDPTLPSSGYVPRTDVVLRNELLAGPCATRDGEIALSSIVSIVDFDGIDDFNGTTGTNNLTAFSKAITYLNSVGGGDLVLPHRGTGVYWINGDDPTQITTNIRLVPAEGVSLQLIYSGGPANSPLADTSKLSSDRQLKMQIVNFGFTTFIGENIGRELGEILPTINNGDGVFSVPTTLVGGDFKVLRLSDTNTAIPPASSTSDSITYAGAGVPTVGVISTTPGDEVMSLLSAPAGGVFFAGVITVKGYAYFSQNIYTGTVVLTEQTTGLHTVVAGVPYALMDQQRDLFNNALLSVKVTSDRSFSMLANGLVIGSYTTRSSILGVCFGTEDINADVSLSQMSKVTGKSFGGSKPLKLVISGDSVTDNAAQYSWAKYLPMVLGSAGINVAEINNIAVAGQTAAQQYALLQTVGAGSDICLIQVGVNDIQGRTSFSAFIATIQGMVTYAKSVGMQPIVGIPTSFYSKAEANANGQTGGQNTANNTSIHTYRALLIRAVADAGGLVNLEPMKSFGAMTAKWLSLAPYSVSDRIVVDNIHPSPYGSMMLAHGWARSIVGYLSRPDTSSKEVYEEIPVSWISPSVGTTDKPLIRGRKLKGMISLHTSAIPDGAVAFKLPPSISVPVVKMVTVTGINASNLPVGTLNMYIGTNGNCYFFNIPATVTKVSVDDVEV